jgi:hypothetical protein
MVPAVGLEPTLLSEQDFESSASTNFTTPAFIFLIGNTCAFSGAKTECKVRFVAIFNKARQPQLDPNLWSAAQANLMDFPTRAM